MTQDKNERYAELVAARKECAACESLTNPAAVGGGALDSDRIGPYSLWQGNLDASLMVVAQDFADVAGFREHLGWPGKAPGDGGPGKAVETNGNLVALLKAAGLPVAPPQRGVSDDRYFFTNAVLCLKQGGMGSAIPSRCFQTCGEKFLRRTVELVAPRAIATLGSHALRALLRAYGQRPIGGVVAAVEEGLTYDLPGGVVVFPMCHPSRRVINSMRDLEQQKGDWRRLGDWLRAARRAA